jgi:hypothetical protein
MKLKKDRKTGLKQPRNNINPVQRTAYPLSAALRGFYAASMIRRLSYTLLITAFLFPASASLEYFYNYQPAARTALFYALAVSVSVCLIHFIFEISAFAYRYLKPDRSAVGIIDSDHPGQKVLMIHDLYYSDNPSALSDSALKDLTENLINSGSVPSYLSLRVSGRYFRNILVSAAAAAVVLIPGPLSSGIFRIANHDKDFTPAPSHYLKLTDISEFAAEKDTLTLSCVSQGNAPDVIILKKRYAGDENFSSGPAAVKKDGSFSSKVAESKSYYYFFESAETSSDTAFVTVLKRPGITQISVSVKSPSYTNIPVREYTASGTVITAYKGSSASVSVKLSENDPDSVSLIFGDGQKMPFAGSGTVFGTEFQIMQSSSFSVGAVKSSNGIVLKNADAMVHRIDLIPDDHPSVNLIFPEEGHLLDESMEIPVFATCSDDFQISEVYIYMRKLSFNQFSGKTVKTDFIRKKVRFESDGDGISLVNTYVPASELRLLPEDKIELYLRAYDNDRVSGPKYTDSKIRTISLPSLEQLFSETTKNYDDQDRILKEGLEKNASVLEKLSELSEKLKKNQDFGFEEEMKMKNITEDQEKMEQSLAGLKEEIKKNVSLLDENSMLSEETMKKYMKLQKLADEIFSGDMKEKLKKLNEMQSGENIDKNKMSELLKDFENEQKKFKEEIEKSISILQQIKNEYLIDKLMRQLDDMITKQNEINTGLESEDRQDLLIRQKKNESAFELFKSELINLEGGFDKEQTDAFTGDLDKKDLPGDFKNMAGQIGQSENEKAKKTGTDISSKLLDTKNKLSELKKKMMDEQRDELKKEIEAVISDLLVISADIEEIKNFSKTISASSSHSGSLVRQISRTVSFFESVKNKIFLISKKTFFIDKKIIAKMGMIAELFSDVSRIFESRGFVSSYQKNSVLMGSVNSLIIQLSEAAEELQKSQSPSGLEEMIKKMEEMARMQAMLNSQTSSMMPMSGEGMSQIQEMMNRLAMEQAQLYDALMKMQSQMGQKPGQEGSPGQDGKPGESGMPSGFPGGGSPGQDGSPGSSGAPKNSGEGNSMPGGSGLGNKLGDIGKEMKEAENLLKDKKLDEYLLSKQEQVLDKLLDAIEAAKREKYDNKRESRSGGLKAVDPGKIEIKFDNNLREMLIRSLRDGYTDKYKQKIREYFKELEN